MKDYGRKRKEKTQIAFLVKQQHSASWMKKTMDKNKTQNKNNTKQKSEEIRNTRLIKLRDLNEKDHGQKRKEKEEEKKRKKERR